MQDLYEQSRDKAFDARRIWRQAEREGRELTDAEREQMEFLIDKADELREQAKALEPLRGLAPAGVVTMDPNVAHGGERPGDAFVKSKGYQAIRDSAARPSQWSSGPVEVKATLLEGDLDTPGEGAALSQFDVRPGVQPILFQPITIASLMASVQTSSNRVRVIVETVASDAAATSQKVPRSPSRRSSSMRPTSRCARSPRSCRSVTSSSATRRRFSHT